MAGQEAEETEERRGKVGQSDLKITFPILNRKGGGGIARILRLSCTLALLIHARKTILP